MATCTITSTINHSGTKYKFGPDKRIEMCIYCITNKSNGKIYVGQSRKKVVNRWRSHLNKSGSGTSLIKNTIRKNGINMFEFKVIDFCESIEQLDYKEQFYISLLNTISPDGYNLCNGGSNGRVFSNESKMKMKISALRRRNIEISAKDIRLSMSKEEKELRKSNGIQKMKKSKLGVKSKIKGRKLSSEHIEKIAKSKTGKEISKKWKKIISSDGIIFNSLKECIQTIGCNKTTLSKHLSGKLKTIYGKSYKYMIKEV